MRAKTRAIGTVNEGNETQKVRDEKDRFKDAVEFKMLVNMLRRKIWMNCTVEEREN